MKRFSATQSRASGCIATLMIFLLVAAAPAAETAAAPLAIGSRLELFVDRYLVEQSDGTRLAIGRPRYEGEVLRFDAPWENAFGSTYVTVIKDGPTYRAYYRATSWKPDGKALLAVCYAESRDGIRWTKPRLGICDFNGSKDNNIILVDDERRAAANFSVFLDDRPGVPASERFKGMGGLRPEGLSFFCSGDGIHWKLMFPEKRFANYALDSLNVGLWSPAEQVYAIYLRTFSEGGTEDNPEIKGIRTISRSVSKDFRAWSKPEPMTFGDTPLEELYTNGTTPYFRAPHMLIALAGRFWPDRRVLADDEMDALQVHANQRQGLSDAVLLTSRGGISYDRTFMESFIRPGPDHRAWSARNNYPATGIVPTGDREISIYSATWYAQPGNHLDRYSLRPDGFGSMHADYAEGSFTTHELTFDGQRLVLNCATSAAGRIRVGILGTGGTPVPGFSADDCDEIIGDEIARTVTWKGRADVAGLSGKPVRLRFLMKDADLYSMRFMEADENTDRAASLTQR